MDGPYYVYILRCYDGSYYVGFTNNVDARVIKHNQGHAATYTTIRRPVTLAYAEEHPDQLTAMRRERQLKGWSHEKRQALIHGDAQLLKQLSKRRS